MGLFTNPLGHAGYPPNVTAPATVVNSTVRAATEAEVLAGVLTNVYVAPATLVGGIDDAAVAQGAITNSVTAGGVTGTIANFTDLTTYATDAATIRNDIYQLALGLSNVVTALRNYGLLT